MAYEGIKRILGESSLERKIQILFAVCLLTLICGAFLWINRISEDLIDQNTSEQAEVLVSDFVFRAHMKQQASQPNDSDEPSVLEGLSAEPSARQYEAIILSLENGSPRKSIRASTLKGAEAQRLEQIVEFANQQQSKQNELESIRTIGSDAYERAIDGYQKALESPEETFDSDTKQHYESTRTEFYYYAPLVFKSNSLCLQCHAPVTTDSASTLAQIENELKGPNLSPEATQALELKRLNQAAPLFVRIKLDNQIAQRAVTQSRAILISVAIVCAVLSVGMLWMIVRYVIVKPLAHLRDVTEKVVQGRTDIRANLKTGDEFEVLAKSLNRMLRQVLETQEAMQEANDDLDRKVNEQAQLNLKLHEMNQLKSEFLANMSHELRTPLNSIIGFSELLESAKALEEKQQRFASNIRRSGNLLLEIINDILDLAKLEAGKMDVRLAEFSIAALVGEMSEMVMHLAAAKNIRLDTNVPEQLPVVISDRLKIQQIMTNLLSNAIKFTPEGGRITVDVYETVETQGETKEPMLNIDVRDTGIGIAPADQEIVFEKFRQGPSAIGDNALTREVSGTGLGLSIVKEICILLGGNISLESVVGSGSVFRVKIPWVYSQTQKIDSELTAEIDQITKSQRVDLGRAIMTPVPPERVETETDDPS